MEHGADLCEALPQNGFPGAGRAHEPEPNTVAAETAHSFRDERVR